MKNANAAQTDKLIEEEAKKFMIKEEWIDIVEKFIKKNELVNVTPNNEGLIEFSDILKIEMIVFSSLIEISKSIEESHRDRRRELLRA